MLLNADDILLKGQYRTLRLLGRDGFGFVYQAGDTLLHREIAIKELVPALVGHGDKTGWYLAEARATIVALAGLSGAVIVTSNLNSQAISGKVVQFLVSGWVTGAPTASGAA